MEVRATAQGYYDLKIRQEGAEFTIKSEKDFSKVWMEKIGESAKGKKSGTKLTPAEVHSAAMEKALPGAMTKDSKEDVI